MKAIRPLILKGLVLSSFVFLFYCEESKDPPVEFIPDERVWETTASVFPNIGTANTYFQPELITVVEGDTVTLGVDYQIRCDYDNDGIAETDWLNSLPETPAFSTYGKHVLNVEIATPAGQIMTSAECSVYVQQLLQITPTNTSGNVQGNITWLKNGSNRIAFDMKGEDANSGRSIWVVDYPNGDPIQVTSSPATTENYYHTFPEWSPDGDRIAYSNDGIEIMNVSSGITEMLDERGGVYAKSWSPDGRWLIYWSRYNSETLVYDFVNDSSSVLFDDQYVVGWSPDGGKLATCQMGDWENSTLQIIDFESKAVLEEHIVPTHGYKLEWSPDGKWISVGFDGHKKYGLIFNCEAKTTYTWEPDDLSACWYPSWSGDGSLLAFEAVKPVSGVSTSIWAIELPEELVGL